MTFTRKNVWELGDPWADPILWYARGVKAMKSRALNEQTGWRFYGAIHGFDPQVWSQLGLLSSNDQMPSRDDIGTYWQQCQHGSWYFLPWHRGYLLSFEAVLRDAITKLGGPADWALPYWNYFKPNQNQMPPAFASQNWPDGQGDNPLFDAQRFGPGNDGNVFIPMDQVDLNALRDDLFAGAGSGGGQGFGGVSTGFSHSGSVHGGIESQPHDMVHVFVGGSDPDSGLPGLMSDPDVAGLDPIFWLHHANIDRLWEVWNEASTSHADPTASRWLKGPASTGEHPFVLPMPGGTSFNYTPADMKDLAQLGYNYDDVSAPEAQPRVAMRLQRFGVSPTAARSITMAEPQRAELLGASGSLSLSGKEASTSVVLDPAVQRKVTTSMQGVTATPRREPDRIFLNLENVRGVNDATAISVYINVPDGEDPAKHPELKAGDVALFGLRKASLKDDKHAGDGLTFVLEITDVIDRLHLSGSLSADQLHVRLVPRNPVPAEAQISIGRISVYRQPS